MLDDPFKEPIKSVTRDKSYSPDKLPAFKPGGGKMDTSIKSFLGVSQFINQNKFSKTPTRIANYVETSMKGFIAPKNGPINEKVSPYGY